jgi:hypothetical protein
MSGTMEIDHNFKSPNRRIYGKYSYEMLEECRNCEV